MISITRVTQKTVGNTWHLFLPESSLEVYQPSAQILEAERIYLENEEDLREKIKPPYKPDEIKRPHRLSQYKDNDINHRSWGRQNNKPGKWGNTPCQCGLPCAVT